MSMRAPRLHPGRWRFVLRDVVVTPGRDRASTAARIPRVDWRASRYREAPRLMRVANARFRGPHSLGRSLARQTGGSSRRRGPRTRHRRGRRSSGRWIGDPPQGAWRFCASCSRDRAMSSTRDQVLDALWPELDPLDALNSLNQTVYFLRRVLEESYVDDLSPGYRASRLRPDLAGSGTRHEPKQRMSRADQGPSRSHPTRTKLTPWSTPIEGRFALDFEYEEWAAPYRDWLHASYLEVVERAVASDLETGHFDRGIRLARRVLDVDPGAETCRGIAAAALPCERCACRGSRAVRALRNRDA